MKQFTTLSKLRKGDQVAVISPSAGLAGLFPWVQDLGLERLRTEFGLIALEYPTTRQMGSTLEDRARDIMAAFADADNKAVFSSIGGSDQIKLLKHLDPSPFIENPKPFFGFSDNTHLIHYLWNLGIPSYYGGAILTQFAMQGRMDELTKTFLRHALFDAGEFELSASPVCNDIGLDWADEGNLAKTRIVEPNDGWHWDGDQDARGILWGGCVESLVAQFAAGAYLPDPDNLDQAVLFLETAEDIPEPWLVEHVLAGMGERGWLNKFHAVLAGRPQAWEFDKPNNAAQKAAYRQEQREAVVRTVREYNPHIPIVQNLDFGHTNPQICLPVGRNVRVDCALRKIFADY